MKIKILCAVSVVIVVLSGGVILRMNGFSDKMQQRESLLLHKQALEAEITTDQAALGEVEAFLMENEEQSAIYKEQSALLREKQSEVRKVVEQFSGLYEFSLGGMPVNYDVENFREAEKLDGQTTQMVGTFFGGIIEGILSNKEESNVASAEKLRLSLYEYFSDFLEESFQEVSAAKAVFDGSYSFYFDIAQADDEESLFVYSTLLEEVQTEKICMEEREDLLQGMAKYIFDLSCVYKMYETTLTEHETAFLKNLKIQLNTFKQLEAVYDPDGSQYGYTGEEQLERYRKLLYQYVDVVEELGLRNADNGIKNGGKYTDYGVGVNQGFLNKGKVILMYGNVSDTGLWEPKKYFYDSEGNPIYIKIGIAEVILKDGQVLEVLPAEVETYQTEEWQQERILEALDIKKQFEAR